MDSIHGNMLYVTVATGCLPQPVHSGRGQTEAPDPPGPTTQGQG